MKLRQRIRLFLLFFSLMLFPVTMYLLSPYLPFMAASENILAGSIMVFLGLAMSAVFLGRSFCGWLCPAGGFEEILGIVRPKQVRRKMINWIKFVIWGPWLALFAFVVISSGGLNKVELFYQFEKGISIARPEAYIIYYGVLFIFLVLSLSVGKRAACHTICWMAPFMIIGQKLGSMLRIPSLGLISEPEKCVDCCKCTEACSMSVDVQKELKNGRINSADCIVCGACADACSKNVLSYSIGKR